VSLTDRDRKIVIILVPLLAVLGYWFLLFSPKREEAARAADELAKQEQRRDTAAEQARSLDSMKTDFASEYAQLVRLGKAIPSSVDMPSLLVQLDQAARGTGIKFKRVAAGQRRPAPAQGASAASTPAAAGGAGAQSGPGKSAESAGNATGATNSASAKSSGAGAEGQPVAPADAQTSTSSKQGGVPVGGGATPGGSAPGSPSSGAPGLDSVPLEFEFEGSFFDLADLFHRLKRFVQVANRGVVVRGRLLTIDTVSFSSGEARFPKLKAAVTATVYLAPKAEGATAGASPQGPAGSSPAGSTPAGTSPPPQGSQPAGATSPTATPSKP